MKATEFRTLIKESIQEYIKEIDAAGNRAALEAKITKTQEAIDLRKKKLNMEGLDEAYHDMMDKGKMKEMTSEIKLLEKSLTKYGKMLEKMDTKATPKQMKDESMMDEEVIDEVDIDEAFPESGPQLEENIDSDVRPYDVMLNVVKGYEGLEDYVGSFMKNFPKGKPITKDAWLSWHRTIDGGYDPEGYSEEYWNNPSQLEEAKKKMTAAQKEKKEDIVKRMKKSKSFGKSKEEKGKMYATATKLAMKESEELNESFLHMQKLAGLITEAEYKAKLDTNSEDK